MFTKKTPQNNYWLTRYSHSLDMNGFHNKNSFLLGAHFCKPFVNTRDEEAAEREKNTCKERWWDEEKLSRLLPTGTTAEEEGLNNGN